MILRKLSAHFYNATISRIDAKCKQITIKTRTSIQEVVHDRSLS
jgi:hypothetical protein